MGKHDPEASKMTSLFKWCSYLPNPAPGSTQHELREMEKMFNVRFPKALRLGYLVSNIASIFIDGKLCATAVSGPRATGGEYKGFLQDLDPLERMPREQKYLQDWVDDVYERSIDDVIPFVALDGGGWTCLNYQNDSTRANPEIWQFDTNGTSFDDCFTKVADNFDHLIEMLVAEDDLLRLGFG